VFCSDSITLFEQRITVYETIALVGATGAVGRIVLEQLVQRKFPYKRLKLLASERSVGREVRVGSETITVELLQSG
jgi:aspartate-semialdehyde dehydrogenase